MNEQELIDWCANIAKNGISQHDDSWLRAKQCTVGGSSIAILDGSNTFNTLYNYVATKLGLAKFESDVKPQWGNLFEPVIQLEVEIQWQCKVHGEDLYIEGAAYGTSYSPDGLAIIGEKVTLLEFKCPYSRIPGRQPPKYYVPQVKMGLCMTPASEGLYIEAVYRRCSWNCLGPVPGFDLKLVDRPKTGLPVSYGFIGFYADPESIRAGNAAIMEGSIEFIDESLVEYDSNDDNVEAPTKKPAAKMVVPGYLGEYRRCNAMNDLGMSSPRLFKNLMMLMDKGYIKAWYGKIHKERDPNRANFALNKELQAYREFCTKDKRTNYGFLPWKLLRIESHKIDHEPDFLDPHLPNIKKIIDFVKEWKDCDDAEKKRTALDRFITEYHRCGLAEYDDDD